MIPLVTFNSFLFPCLWILLIFFSFWPSSQHLTLCQKLHIQHCIFGTFSAILFLHPRLAWSNTLCSINLELLTLGSLFDHIIDIIYYIKFIPHNILNQLLDGIIRQLSARIIEVKNSRFKHSHNPRALNELFPYQDLSCNKSNDEYCKV